MRASYVRHGFGGGNNTLIRGSKDVLTSNTHQISRRHRRYGQTRVRLLCRDHSFEEVHETVETGRLAQHGLNMLSGAIEHSY